MAWFTKSICLW